MARFSSLGASRYRWRAGQEHAVFSVLSEFFAKRFKELNTYSDRLTRCIAMVFGRIAQRGMGSAAG
jgi:hypothetical protein